MQYTKNRPLGTSGLIERVDYRAVAGDVLAVLSGGRASGSMLPITSHPETTNIPAITEIGNILLIGNYDERTVGLLLS